MNILLLEDDIIFAQLFKSQLSEIATIVHCRGSEEALRYLENSTPDLALIDLNLAHQNGLDILQYIDCPKAILSNSQDPEEIEKAYQLGVEHFFTKRGFKTTIPQFIEGRRFTDDFKKKISAHFLTDHPPLLTQLKTIIAYPLKEKSLFLTGPTGVGKSLLGKTLHLCFYNETAPFVHLNCSEISDSLIESELFGHEKGAFTGATQKKIGKLKLADGGTLFLDEIGTMSIEMQKKLLKAIEEKTFYPVGSSRAEQVSFTLISASCENIEHKIEQGLFREDLYYRLKSFTFHIPPLSDRPEDVELLLKYFIDKSDRLVLIKNEAWAYLKSHRWPGNIRELKNLAERLIHHPKGIVDLKDVEQLLDSSSASVLSHSLTDPELKEKILQMGLRHYVQKLEEEMVEYALAKYQGKITDCIKGLRISSSAFYRISGKK